MDVSSFLIHSYINSKFLPSPSSSISFPCWFWIPPLSRELACVFSVWVLLFPGSPSPWILEPNWSVHISIFRAFPLGVICVFELIFLSSPKNISRQLPLEALSESLSGQPHCLVIGQNIFVWLCWHILKPEDLWAEQSQGELMCG